MEIIQNFDSMNEVLNMSATKLLSMKMSGASYLPNTHQQSLNSINNFSTSPGDKKAILLNHSDIPKKELQKEHTAEFILDKLLEQIKPVRFTELAGLKDGETLKNKRQMVLVIRQVQEIADLNKSGFMVDDYQVHVYTGTYWLFVDEDTIRSFLGKAAAKLGVNSLDAEAYDYREKLLKQFMEVIPKPSKSDSRKVLINLANGTLHVSGKGKIEMLPFQKVDYLKYQLDYKFDEHTEYSLFQNFINRIMPDKNTQAVLRQFVGSAFIKDVNFQRTLWLVGKGRNGKSTFLEIITALIGKVNVTNYSPEQLTQTNSYERGEIAGKLLNLSDEMGDNIGIPLFKKMVCGEPVPTRRIYGSPFTMYDYPKMIVNVNRLPKRIETTDAFYRRLLIATFDTPITEEECDYNIAGNIIEKELPGVLLWVIIGIKELMEQKGFTKSDLVNDAVRAYRLDTDNISSFIEEEEYVIDRTNKILLKELYSIYVKYCKDRGFNKYDYNDFSSKLKDMGFEYKRETPGYCVLINKKKDIM